MLNLGFWDFWSRYFYLAFVKKVYQLVTTFNPENFLSKVFIQYYSSSVRWFLSLVLFQLVEVFHKEVFYSHLAGSSLANLVFFISLRGFFRFREGVYLANFVLYLLPSMRRCFISYCQWSEPLMLIFRDADSYLLCSARLISVLPFQWIFAWQLSPCYNATALDVLSLEALLPGSFLSCT